MTSVRKMSSNLAVTVGDQPYWKLAAELVPIIGSEFDRTLSPQSLHLIRNVDMATFAVERSRFQAWAYVMGFAEMYGSGKSLNTLLCGRSGHKTFDILDQLRRTFAFQRSQVNTPDAGEFQAFTEKISRLLRDLEEVLPENDQKTMAQVLSTRLLEPEDVYKLETLLSSSFIHENPNLEATAAMKRIRILSKKSESIRQGRDKLLIAMENLTMENEQYRRTKISIGSFMEGQSASQMPIPILIEWKKYEGLWDTDIGNLLFRRTEMLTSFLRTASNGSELLDLRILKCLGYCHDERHTRLGFVFVNPSSSVEYPASYFSLNQCLESQKNGPPLLGDRFRLAKLLSAAIFEFHKASWVHKSFSSHNIMFFPDLASSEDDPETPPSTSASTSKISILAPYIVGFNHSRLDQPNQFSEPANLGLELQRYRHPEYKNRPMQYFHRAFDYYSLGIVLLEIGLWYPLSLMLKRHKELSADEFTAELLKSFCPMLGSCMGSIYQDVVVDLLTHDWGRGQEELTVEGEAEARAAQLMNFHTRVLAQLERCCA